MVNIKKYRFILVINLVVIILGIYNLPSLLIKPTIETELTDSLFNLGKFKIDDMSVNSKSQLEIILDKYKVDDIVIIKMSSSDKNIEVKLSNYYDSGFLISTVFTSIFFIFPGIFILIKIKDKETAVLFNLMMLSVCSLLLLTYGSIDYGLVILNAISRTIVQISYIYLSILFIEFSFQFPIKKYPNFIRHFSKVNLSLLILIVPFLLINYLYIQNQYSEIYEIYYQLNNFILKPFFGISILIVLVNLIITYKSNISSINRQKLLWIIVSILWGPMIYFLLYQIPFLFDLEFGISETLMQYLIVISPIALFIGIYKYNLFDINLFFKRSFVYSLLISLIIIIYTSLLFVFSNFISENTNSQLPYILSLILIALIFQPLRKLILNFTDKYVFKIKFDVFKIIENFKQEISSIFSKEDTLNLFVNYLLTYIIPKNYFFITKMEDNGFEIVTRGLINLDNIVIDEILNSIDFNSSISPISKNNYFVDDVSYSLHNLELLRDEFDLVFFNKSKDIEFYLFVGKKSNNILYTSDDVYLINNLIMESNNQLSRVVINKNLLFKIEEVKKLEELNAMKSLFVSSVTHDLKTPLTSIKLLAELMLTYNNINFTDKEKYLKLIISESDRLNRLVNNVLHFSKIERNTKVYNFQQNDLNELIDNVILTVKNNILMKKFVLHYIKNEELYLANIDSDAITEVIHNLIENAVKYSVAIKEIKVATYKRDSHYMIEVSDKGIGISEENQKKIFEPYSRANDERIKSISGTGIGLSIVKNIIDAHNGRIEITSKIDEGSTFKIYLKEFKNENFDS